MKYIVILKYSCEVLCSKYKTSKTHFLTLQKQSTNENKQNQNNKNQNFRDLWTLTL